MVGLGLESLIPKKNNAEKSFLKDAVVPTESVGTPLAHISSSSDLPSQATFPHMHKGKGYFQEAIFHIEVERIKPNPYQPRREFNEENLKELSQSIREFGIIQPLIVSKIIKETETGTQVEYQLIAGERRLMAAKIAGLPRVPAIVRKITAERDKLELALIENVQRSNLNPIESAKAYSRLQDEFNLTQREIATRIGKSREVVANTLRLLNLPLNVQEAIAQNKITESQARALLSISDFKSQDEEFQKMAGEKRGSGNRNDYSDPQKIYWEKQLEEKLGAPVKVLKQGSRGKMVIQFFSEEEWQAILNKLLGEEKLD